MTSTLLDEGADPLSLRRVADSDSGPLRQAPGSYTGPRCTRATVGTGPRRDDGVGLADIPLVNSAVIGRTGRRAPDGLHRSAARPRPVGVAVFYLSLLVSRYYTDRGRHRHSQVLRPGSRGETCRVFRWVILSVKWGPFRAVHGGPESFEEVRPFFDIGHKWVEMDRVDVALKRRRSTGILRLLCRAPVPITEVSGESVAVRVE